ncbi:RDD family protein [Porticoccus sp.]|uniref:RDD family protein n=1 Tax=Porticoccus sp. TaxID=2024853 RepID=UPI000C5EF0EF|nr:RDD family protein [Porticoccus sp.]MAZ69087.1 RDD family protein [Porticoccus sp.]|tara:strand:+ start:51626 stop:52063 length:438 start_codon:yes stop_codon:yes gene_type:complete
MENKEYAGFWIRFGALLIDLVIMAIVLYVPLSLIYGEEYWIGDKLIYGFWDVMLGYVVPFVATIWFWLHYLGTPGKMAMKLQIVDASTGGKMRTGQAIGRYFAYILSAVPLCLGFIWVGVDQRKQGWHDKLAGTVVIRNTGKEPV